MLQGDAAGGGFILVMMRCLTAVAFSIATSLLASQIACAVESVNVRLDAAA